TRGAGRRLQSLDRRVGFAAGGEDASPETRRADLMLLEWELRRESVCIQVREKRFRFVEIAKPQPHLAQTKQAPRLPTRARQEEVRIPNVLERRFEVFSGPADLASRQIDIAEVETCEGIDLGER